MAFPETEARNHVESSSPSDSRQGTHWHASRRPTFVKCHSSLIYNNFASLNFAVVLVTVTMSLAILHGVACNLWVSDFLLALNQPYL